MAQYLEAKGMSVGFTSEGPEVRTPWLRKGMYKIFNSDESTANLVGHLSEAELEDIRIRCRWVRLLDQEQAYRLIGTMWRLCDKMLAESRPQMMYGLPIDYYGYDETTVGAVKRAYSSPVP